MARPNTLRGSVPGLGRLVRRFQPYLRRQAGLTVGAFAALFAEVALRLLEPWPLKFVFDHVLAPGSSASGTAADPATVLGLAAAAVVLLAATRAFAAYLSTVGFALVGQRVLTQVRGDLFHHLQRLSLNFTLPRARW